MKPRINRPPVFSFRLYVAGTTSNSVQAIANLALLCRTHLLGRHELEVIDVLRHPHRALADRIFMTPILVKFAPDPECRIIGTLHQEEKVLRALGLDSPAV
jgi:circadian clock protein KaiB